MNVTISKYLTVNKEFIKERSLMVAFLNSDCTFTLLQNLQGFMCVRVCVSKTHLDPAEHAGIEDVHAGVDLVGDENLRFLNEPMYNAAVWLKHHHAVFRGLLHTRYLNKHTAALNSQYYTKTLPKNPR